MNRTVGDSEPQLTYVTSGGNAIVKVDNTCKQLLLRSRAGAHLAIIATVPYNQKRNSVRLTSTDAFEIGSVWVMDALHLPYGCSKHVLISRTCVILTPSRCLARFVRRTNTLRGLANLNNSWSTGVGATWPATGEIDTFEGVNNQAGNQMALHTADG